MVRTLHEHPFTATLGLETLRGAKAVALPARAIIRADFIVQIYPLLVCLTMDHDDMMHKPLKGRARSVSPISPRPDFSTAPGRRRAVSGGPHPACQSWVSLCLAGTLPRLVNSVRKRKKYRS